MTAVKIQQAQVQRAQVEIRMITVSGRKMTQSLFRQIEIEDPFDDQGDPLGILWGRVNYLVARKEIHVLWQKGDELRRWPAGPNDRVNRHIAKHSETRNMILWALGDHPRREDVVAWLTDDEEKALACDDHNERLDRLERAREVARQRAREEARHLNDEKSRAAQADRRIMDHCAKLEQLYIAG